MSTSTMVFPWVPHVFQNTCSFPMRIEAHLNRLMMLVELGFYVVDFVLDFEMLSLLG